MVTTALGPSRVWATLGYGIVNEVYWPSAGRPQIRDLGFIVAGRSQWHEVKRVARYLLSLPEPFIPLPRIVHESEGFANPGGYHLVWTRDAVEAGLALLSVGQIDDARRMLIYLMATQRPDGGWSQNGFPDGRPFWTGVQLDEVGFPILLAAKLEEHGGLDGLGGIAAMIRRAAAYLAQNGPISPQDRWEENPGISPFTLGIEIAALVAAADHLPAEDRPYALSLADYWNERLEDWTYVESGAFIEEFGVEGYYVRVAPAMSEGGLCGRVDVRNRGGERVPAVTLIGMEYLYLPRLGLRDPRDPRIQDTLKISESILKVETPHGVAYRRYNGDGYGEHEDGRPFDGTGIGRGWPLLTGERGYLDVLLGIDPLSYLEMMTRMTGPAGLIPEQVWDGPPLPDRGLNPGRPTGSAMPLVWAHAEFLNLVAARHSGRPPKLLACERRYQAQQPVATPRHWRRAEPFDRLPSGRPLADRKSRSFPTSPRIRRMARSRRHSVRVAGARNARRPA
jgi:glucoamylase